MGCCATIIAKRLEERGLSPVTDILAIRDIGAASVKLTGADLREIETTAAKIDVQGARYPEHLERLSYR